MDKTEILKNINAILCDIFNDPTIVVTENSSAQNIARWDSITHVNILMTVERTFKVRFSLGEIKKLQNVGEMVSLLHEKLTHTKTENR